MKETDVIIVGLGPTGATLAGLLGQRGLSVTVFDRLPDLFPLPRAAGLDHEVMRIAQELQVADRLAAHIAPYRPSEYRGMQGQLIKRLDAAPPPHRLGWAPNYVFEQPAFERILRARLAELPNVHVATSAEVREVGQDDQHAWADVVLPGDAEPTRHVARWLIACDGGSSPVRKRLGLTLEDLGFDEPWLVVDAIVSEAKLAELPQTQVQYCEAERPCTYVVGVGRHRRWEIMLLPGDSLSSDFPDEQLWPLLERWLKPGEAQIWRAAAYRFHGLVANQWRRDRILLAGDAAHMTPPFMAQGMVQGMRDALNLAWKLDDVHRGRASHRLLDSYQAERRPQVVATTRVAMELGRVICERDPERARERDARLLAEQGGQVSTRFRQDMIPGIADGLIETATPGAGSIVPQPLVRDGERFVRLDDVSGRGVRLVAIEALRPDEVRAARQALAPLGGTLVVLTNEMSADVPADGVPVIHAAEDVPVMAPWLAKLERRFALVRPDHCVYGTAASLDEALTLIARLQQSFQEGF
ncbi:bifunctional 3-(3-hydroxy-phenyl)propionate/3-hydroxycinnamic acid hydroxylase [Aquincola sp. S2]|uniref:Bifunctional 3-(3-hydroxy-phenyl)propionate/3-hydroxycinnamic acid hydroxylase n=1 Tax=Pseudaquabacterium terrae TaxID=2732868 RepID=A0ABX2EGG4_9BURK|nr:bifunctional 3-(3-hydroxy-phenyl)propionate/3-hydroxycinnamic acid hydroxylase [Aquabacterium terrae]NRF67724.1 bifunctional 3-(3-hydroxy-phenyl)propionate/3-hydroxycinnamic acid hydroxylase [Aquabacterium terrae]